MAISFANGFGCEASWLQAALRILPDDPTIFLPSREAEAMTVFGIGNRKVQALNAWLRGMGLAIGTPSEMRLTPLGRLIRSGDPTLRKTATWWLLHFHLSLPAPQAKVYHELWQWFADEPFLFGFDAETLRTAASRAFPNASERTVRTGLGEVLSTIKNTPLGGLGLLSPDPSGDDKRLCKVPPPQGSLTAPSLLAGVARQMELLQRDSLSFDEIATLPGGAARVINLPRSQMAPLLDWAAGRYGSHLVAVTRTAGLDTVWLGERNAAYWLAYEYAEQDGASAKEAEEQARRIQLEE